jgi:hypothetical protein
MVAQIHASSSAWALTQLTNRSMRAWVLNPDILIVSAALNGFETCTSDLCQSNRRESDYFTTNHQMYQSHARDARNWG